MPDTFTFENRGQLVYCRYTGLFALEPMWNFSKEANEFCVSNGYKAILVDITESQGDVGVFDRFKHAKAPSELIDKRLKIAILERPEQEVDGFWETVARNRLVKVKVFTDLDLAEIFAKNKVPHMS
jgi:hypothetical protein